MVLPGAGSQAPVFQSFTSKGWPSSPGVSCKRGVRTTSCSTPSSPSTTSENLRAIDLKMSQSLRASQTGSTAAVSGWKNDVREQPRCVHAKVDGYHQIELAVG